MVEKATHSLLGDREDRIRTCDTLVPNQVLYQAELLPDMLLVKRKLP